MNNGVNQRSQLVVFQFPEDGDPLSNSGDNNYGCPELCWLTRGLVMDAQFWATQWQGLYGFSQPSGHLDDWFICVSIFCTFPIFMTSIMIRMICFSFEEKTCHKFVKFSALSHSIPHYIHVFFPVSSHYYPLVDEHCGRSPFIVSFLIENGDFP